MGKEYEIDGKTYVQKPLVLGQNKQLLRVLDGVEMPEQLTLASLLDALGERLYAAIAVVITEKGCSPRDKNVDELAGWLEWSMDNATATEVVADFFDLNPVSSLLEKAGRMIAGLNRAIALRPIGIRGNGSTNPSSSSPGATSPGATPSSGDTLSTSASPG